MNWISINVIDVRLVIRILSAMEKDNQQAKDQQQQQSTQQQSTNADPKMDLQDEFLNTGRIGRRNAMPDILDEHCETSTADLPLKLSALTTSGEWNYLLLFHIS